MLIVRGTSRQSHITGSSDHNQRIEYLWRDTFRCVGHLYYSLFFDMEDCDLLDANSDHYLFSLHYTYLPRINNQLEEFASAWNSHPLRTEGSSPLQMWHICLLSSSAECQEEILLVSQLMRIFVTLISRMLGALTMKALLSLLLAQ